MVAAGRLLGISKVEYWRWEAGLRRIPPEKVPYVEAITGVPREVLRPDVYCVVSKQFALEHERAHLVLGRRP
jgi:DNA-binding transcriptional regulator YdaS (Cro superfamily)